MNIDWEYAPDWAIGHAIHAFANEVKEVWVGEAQYQRVDHSKPFPYGGGTGEARYNPTRAQFHYETLRPAPWAGEGLPPVGVVCEFTGTNECGSNVEQLRQGAEVTILAHYEQINGEPLAAFTFIDDEGGKLIGGAMAMLFAPIRTPEQIAADERAAAIKEMQQVVGTFNVHPFECLYDAGYRKQPTP